MNVSTAGILKSHKEKKKTMTKVQMNQDLFNYQQMMKDTLRETLRQHFVAGVRQADHGQVPILSKTLLPPPQIPSICLETYEGLGGDNDYIGITVWHDFGIGEMNLTIRDEEGNLIEQGPVYPFDDNPELWDYLPTEAVLAGTSVIVQVVATDCMGGVTVSREYKRIQ